MTALYMLCALGSFVCFIMVLIQLFKAKGALHGILGFFCMLYPFIWGWMEAKQRNLSKIMLIWSICFGGCIVTGAAAGALMGGEIAKQIEAQQKAQQQAK